MLAENCWFSGSSHIWTVNNKYTVGATQHLCAQSGSTKHDQQTSGHKTHWEAVLKGKQPQEQGIT